MLFRLLLNFILVALSSGVNSSSGGGVSAELLSNLKDVEASKGLFDGGRIYTKQEIDRDLLKAENDELFDAGLSLMESLRSNRREYEDLSLAEWSEATDTLLEIDSWMSSRVAWGNLVIKSYVAEIIMRSIYLRLNGNPSREELDAYRAVITDLDARLPSKAAMAVIAARYYEIEIDEEVNGLGYGKDRKTYESLLRLEGRVANGIRKTVFKSVDLKKMYGQNAADEERVLMKANNFLYFYSNPVPLTMTLISNYRSLLWNLYIYSSFVKEGVGISHSWDQITKDKVVEYYIGSGFSEWAVPLAVLPENKDAGDGQYYFRDVRRGEVIDALRVIFYPEAETSRQSLFQSVHGLE